jgi:hypothetical protein
LLSTFYHGSFSVFEGGEGELKVKEVLVAILFVETIVLCIMGSFRFINNESTIALFIFNAFFISIIFHLDGSLIRKICVLTLGNLIGFFWNLLFFHFFYAGLEHFGAAFTTLYTLSFPFLNLTWVVPFWSFSLSFLTNPKHRLEGMP